MTTFLERASPYIKLGIKLIPIPPREKGCILPSWQTLATTDPEQVQAWNEENPDYNCGLACTPETLCILEFDVPGGMTNAAKEMGQELPATRVHLSGGSGGAHWLFKPTDRSRALGNRKAPQPNGDEWFSLRSVNAYCVGPGSIHPDTGRQYRVAKDRDVAPVPIPDWVCEFVQKHTGPVGVRVKKGRPLDPDFDFEDFCDWYSDVFTILYSEGNYHVTSICPATWEGEGTGRRHTGSKATALWYDGDGLGFSCFSGDDPCSEIKGVRGLLRHLHEQGHEPYRGPIWLKDDEELDESALDDETEEVCGDEEPEEEIISAAELVAKIGQADREPDPEPEATLEPNPVERKSDVMDDPDPLQMLAGIIFRDPKAALGDFVFWRARLRWVVEHKAWPKDALPLLSKLLDYEEVNHRLPTANELLDANLRNPPVSEELPSLVEKIGDVEEGITLDHAAGTLIEQSLLRYEQVTANWWSKQLKLDPKGSGSVTERLNGFRQKVRSRWTEGILPSSRYNEGTLQENADAIRERMVNRARGGDDGTGNPLAFLTGFPTIDSCILSEQERLFGIFSSSSNFKTTLLFSLTYNLARQGKSVLFVSGEHEAERVEEYMALLHGYQVRHMLSRPLPGYKNWSPTPGGRSYITKEDEDNLGRVLEELRSLRTCPGPLEIKSAGYFNNEFDNVMSYMESSNLKRQYSVLVVDPFDLLTRSAPPDRLFSEGERVLSQMLHQRTEFAGGQGLIILTSFQLKKAFQPALAQLKSGQKREGKGWRDVTPADFEELLQPGNIEMYSGAAKYFDMLWGVAARDERMSGGLITCARVRSSRKFSPVWFEVDADSHYAFERVASTEMLIPEFD